MGDDIAKHGMIQNSSEVRSENYLKQIKRSIVFRGISALLSFATLPITIKYLGKETFGVWSTMFATLTWVTIFDLGIGNGLRNKVAEATAEHDYIRAEEYISSGYTMLAIIISLIWALGTIAAYFTPWQSIFNTTSIAPHALMVCIQISICGLLLNFWLGLITSILGALQKTSTAAFGQAISNLLSFLGLIVAYKLSRGSIIYVAFTFSISQITGNLILSIWFFNKHPNLRPSFMLKKKLAQPLLSVGVKFFFIQISGLVIMLTDRLIISQLLGPSNVVQYDIVAKLFSIIGVAHTMIIWPLWSAYTDAYCKKDVNWLKTNIHQQVKVSIIASLAAIILAILAKPIISIWVGSDIVVGNDFIAAFCLYTIISIWCAMLAIFVNGIGKINVQLFCALIGMAINIPIAYLMINQFQAGLIGVILANIASLTLAALLLPLQIRKIVKDLEYEAVYSNPLSPAS